MEHTAYFCSYDDAADGRGDHDLNVAILKMPCDLSCEEVKILRVLKDLRTLKILGTVKAGCELKMAFQKCLGLTEDFENLVARDFHNVGLIGLNTRDAKYQQLS
jgi:hypothetical protein